MMRFTQPSVKRARRPGLVGRRGFTLTEMLVVIGIIVLVLGIVTPMITRAWRVGDRTRTAADLQAIAGALEAYRQDHGDYPRVTRIPPPFTSPADRPNPPTGAQILCQALIAPAQAEEQGGGPTNARKKQDGADGPGFRTRGTSGRVYGPYLPVDRFTILNPAQPADTTNPLLMVIVDRYRKPILYYPAVGKPNIRSQRGYVWDWDYVKSAGGTLIPMYNARDNIGDLTMAQMAPMLGDLNGNGMIDPNEQPATEQPFLLWTAGPDELFGPDAATAGSNLPDRVRKSVEKSDDVTNFRN